MAEAYLSKHQAALMAAALSDRVRTAKVVYCDADGNELFWVYLGAVKSEDQLSITVPKPSDIRLV